MTMQVIFENGRIEKNVDYICSVENGWEIFREGGDVSEIVEAELRTADTVAE